MNGFAVSTADAPSTEDSARRSATAATRPARLMPRVSRKWVPWIIAGAIALAAAGGLWVYYHRPGSSGGAAATGAAAGGKFYTVTPMDMDVKVVKDGELQAVNNIDVMCMVEGQSTIVHIIKEGSEVKKGDLLVEIDSSQIRQQIDQTTLQHQKAEADLKSAREMLAIQQNQNEADIEAAQVQLELARLDLRQYTEGTYPQSLADAQTALEMAAITVKNKEEELEQTRNLFAKGFVTAAEVKSA